MGSAGETVNLLLLPGGEGAGSRAILNVWHSTGHTFEGGMKYNFEFSWLCRSHFEGGMKYILECTGHTFEGHMTYSPVVQGGTMKY